jgi:ketosteroid isomerase-like protein
MSPEQAAGRLDKIGEQTDVYSLGVVLYQLLTGRLPHDTSGSRYEVIKCIVETEVDSPRKYDEYIDSDLESLLLTALAQEPEDRYPSAAVFLQDIKNYLSGEPLLARSLSTTYRIRKRFRKHAKHIAKTLLFVMVMAAIIVVAFCLVSSERNKRLEAEKQAGLRQDGITAQPEQAPQNVSIDRPENLIDNEEVRIVENIVTDYQLAWYSENSSNILEKVISDKAFVIGTPKDKSLLEALLWDKEAAIDLTRNRQAQPRQELCVIRSISVFGPLSYVVSKYSGGSEKIHFLAKDETGWKVISTGSVFHLREALSMKQSPMQRPPEDKYVKVAIQTLMDKINNSWINKNGSVVMEGILSDKAFATALQRPNSPSEAIILNKQTFCELYGKMQKDQPQRRQEHTIEAITVFGPFAYEVGITLTTHQDGTQSYHRSLNAFAKDETGWKMYFSTSADSVRLALGLVSDDEQTVRGLAEEYVNEFRLDEPFPVEKINRICSDDFVVVMPGGEKIAGKGNYIKTFSEGLDELRSGFTSLNLNLEIQLVRMFEDTAEVLGIIQWRGQRKGKTEPFNQAVSVSFTFEKTDGKWLLGREEQRKVVPDVPDIPSVPQDSGKQPWMPRRAAAPAAIQVNGKPFFVICARSCEPNDFAEVAEAGFNVVSSHNAADAYLEDAKRHGLRAIAYTGQNPERQVLVTRVRSLQNDPTLLAWFMPSCPVAYKIHRGRINRTYEMIHSNDKNHPAFLDFVPKQSTWSQVKSYALLCDIVAIEPFIYNQQVIKGLDIRDRILAVSHWTDRAKEEVAADKPLWVLIQAFAGKGGAGMRPTPQQFRATAYLAINHGASGITVSGFKKRLWQEDGYNVMGLGDPQMYELRQEALRVAGEMRQLSPAILAGAVLDEVTIKNDEGKIDFKAYAALDNQRIYLVAINTSNTEVQPTFCVPNMRGTVHIMNELRDIPRPNGEFPDKFEPYQTHIYDIRMKQNLTTDSLNNLVSHPVLTVDVSEISDPPGNLQGNVQKTYLDIIKASVYEEGEDLIFTVTMNDSFPDPKQLGIDDSFTIIWFVDSDRSRVTGQGNNGNDYNIHLSCSSVRGWFASWFKTSIVSENDGITVDRNKLTFHVKANTAMLLVPKSYISSREFDWWINAWTRPSKVPNAASNPSTERATFDRALSDKQAVLVSDFDSNRPFACLLFPGARWRAEKEYKQSVSICEIDETDGACGTSCSLKWTYQIQREWVNVVLRLSGTGWRTPVDLSMVDAISFYIKGTGLRTCGIKFQANALGSNELTGAAIQLDYGLQWRKIVIPFKDNPELKLRGLDLTRMHTISLVDASPEGGSDVVWIDQMYFHIDEQ